MIPLTALIALAGALHAQGAPVEPTTVSISASDPPSATYSVIPSPTASMPTVVPPPSACNPSSASGYPPVPCPTYPSNSSVVSDTTIQYINNTISKYGIPGAVIAVVKGDKERVLTFGVQDKDKTPMGPDTYLSIGSNSKLITSIAISMAINNGTKLLNGQDLSYETKVKDIVPNFKMYDQNITDTVTLFDVLSMRTGLPGHVLSLRPEETPDQYIKRLQYLKTNSQPQEVYQYSNPGYVLISSMFPTLLNVTVEDYVQTHIFKPLNITATYNALAAAEKGHLGQGFLREGVNATACALEVASGGSYISEACLGRADAIKYWTNGTGLEWAGSGSVIMTGNDMAKWTRELLDPKVVPLKVLEGVEFAFPSGNDTTTNDTTPIADNNYQLGVVRQIYRGYTNVLHDGALPGQNSFFTRVRNETVGVFVVCNDDIVSTLFNNFVSFVLQDELLGLTPLDWESRVLEGLYGIPSANSTSNSTGSTTGSTGESGSNGPSSAPAIRPSSPQAGPADYGNHLFTNEGYNNFTLLPLDLSNQTSFEESGIPREFLLKDLSTSTRIDLSAPGTYYAKVNLTIWTHIIFSPWDGVHYNASILYVHPKAIGQVEIQQIPEWGSQNAAKLYGFNPAVFADNGIGLFGNFYHASELLPVSNVTTVEVKKNADVFFDKA